MNSPFESHLVGFLPNLRRFALSISRSASIADDLVQITCEKALKNRGSYTDGTNLDAWLLRILRNSWIDQTRRDAGQGKHARIEDLPELPDPVEGTSAEHRLVLQDTLKAINRLPEDQREVLMLVCVEELSYKDVSAILDVPIGTIMSRLARARKKIADDLGINGAVRRSPDEGGV